MAHDASREDRFTREHGTRDRPTAARGPSIREHNTSWYWLFVIPMVGVLLPSIYNTRSPELFGIPFFYWYQMLWVPITVIITVIVYRKTKGA